MFAKTQHAPLDFESSIFNSRLRPVKNILNSDKDVLL